MAEEGKATVEGIAEGAIGQETTQKPEGILEKIRGLVGVGKKEETDSKVPENQEGQKDQKDQEDQKNQEAQEKKPETGKKEKTYTQEELDAAIQAAKEAVAAQQKEQERLSKLTPQQREAEEQEAMKKQNAELTEKLKRIELEQKAAAMLSEKKLPAGLADFLDYADEAKMSASLEKIGAMYQEQLENGIKERLKGATPKGLGSAANLTDGMISTEIAKRIRGGL